LFLALALLFEKLLLLQLEHFFPGVQERNPMSVQQG
jgi:hypothetical protein